MGQTGQGLDQEIKFKASLNFGKLNPNLDIMAWPLKAGRELQFYLI